MICRLLATRCCISCSSVSFCCSSFDYFPFGVAPVGDVFDRQENELTGISMIEHLACVQQHRASSDTGKIALDFVSLHRGVLWSDISSSNRSSGISHWPLPSP